MTGVTRQRTYLPEGAEAQRVADLFRRLEDEFSQSGQMMLVSPSGEQFSLPGPLFEVLRFVGATLASGKGVSVIPQDTRLTTQEAADFLGISRPTFVKLLESGAMPFETVGRHRRVMLNDVLTYQEKERARRRTVLAQAARDNQESGMLALTVMPKQ